MQQSINKFGLRDKEFYKKNFVKPKIEKKFLEKGSNTFQ